MDFKAFHNLITLFLSNNFLTKIDLSTNRNLQTLIITGNTTLKELHLPFSPTNENIKFEHDYSESKTKIY
jgi:Leucine-rich repeat (LRR) protein